MSFEIKKDVVSDDDYLDGELPETVDGYADDDLPETSGGEPENDEEDSFYIPVYNVEAETKRRRTAGPYARPEGADKNKKPCPYCTTPISKEDCVPFFLGKHTDIEGCVGARVLDESKKIIQETYRKHFAGAYADETSEVKVPEGLFLFPEVEALLDANTSYDRDERKLRGIPGAPTLDASETEMCKYCGQLIPREFWDLDCVGIAFYGSAKVGKTVYLCSLLNNDCEQLSRGVNGFARNLLIGSDMPGDHQIVDDILKAWAGGEMPDPTNVKQLPPVFIKIEWPAEKEGDTPREQLLYLIDQSGEASENDKERADAILKQCDGVLYLIDPIQFPRWQKGHASESGGEDIAYPSDDDEAKVPVSSTVDKSASSDSRKSIPSPLESRKKLLTIPKRKEKSCAVVITKVDRIFNNAGGLFVKKEELEKIPYFETISPEYERPFIPGVVYDFEEEPFYEKAVNKLFDMTGYPMKNIATLFPDKTKYFACSAMGCEPELEERDGTERLYFDYNELNPIHVSDPIIWLMMEKHRKEKKKNN